MRLPVLLIQGARRRLRWEPAHNKIAERREEKKYFTAFSSYTGPLSPLS